jgi:uncharacterized protein YndB with AHSA1/START domain
MQPGGCALNTDRIEKQITIRAPRAKVWQALTDSRKFGEWFGAIFAQPFTPGARLSGKITHKGYEHLTIDITIERVEPEKLFSWRWHPHAIDSNKDYSSEPTTLVVFELKDVPEGTLLTVTESGFDGIPLSRRAEAYRGNENGWTQQVERIDRYVSQAAS